MARIKQIINDYEQTRKRFKILNQIKSKWDDPTRFRHSPDPARLFFTQFGHSGSIFALTKGPTINSRFMQEKRTFGSA